MHLPVFRAFLLGGPVAPCAAVEAEAEAIGSAVAKVRFFGPLNGFRLV